MVTTQPTFNQVFDLASMLSWQEQRRLVQVMQHNLRLNEPTSPISPDELLARVEHADAMIDAGHYMEHEDAMAHFQERKTKKSAAL